MFTYVIEYSYNVTPENMRTAAAHALEAVAAKAASRSLDTTDETTTASLLAMIEELSTSSASLNAELDTQWVM
jgi:hypothetical protein